MLSLKCGSTCGGVGVPEECMGAQPEVQEYLRSVWVLSLKCRSPRLNAGLYEWVVKRVHTKMFSSQEEGMRNLAREAEMWPVRCMSCGKPLAHKRDSYERMLDESMTRKQAMDKLGISKICCRGHVLQPPRISLGLLFDNAGVSGASAKESEVSLDGMPIHAMATDPNKSNESIKSKVNVHTVDIDVSDMPYVEQAGFGIAPEEEEEEEFRPYNVKSTPSKIRVMRAV